MDQAADRTREDVVGLLEGGTTFMTIYRKPDHHRTWIKGAEIRVVTIDATKYIRTEADNLGTLPRF